MTVKEIVEERNKMEQEMLKNGRELEDAISELEETPINRGATFILRKAADRVNEALAAYTDSVDNLIDFENQSFDV